MLPVNNGAGDAATKLEVALAKKRRLDLQHKGSVSSTAERQQEDVYLHGGSHQVTGTNGASAKISSMAKERTERLTEERRGRGSALGVATAAAAAVFRTACSKLSL